MKFLFFILSAFVSIASAGPSGCPTYTPPNSIPLPAVAEGFLDIRTFTNAQKCQVTGKVLETYYYEDAKLSSTFPSGYYLILGPCNSFVPSIPPGLYLIGKRVYPSICPSGYTQSGSNCIISNMELVKCPPCVAGDSIGQGGASTDLVCVGGCVVKPKGMTAAEIDASGNQIGIKLAEWVKTGSECVAGGSIPVANNIDNSKPNCVNNGARELCISKEKPGCGMVNGKEWCPDKVGCGSINGVRVCVPDDGGCTPSGGLDFACTKGATPPAPPAGEPLPVVDFKASVPVQNAPAPTGGTPTTGAMPKTDGSDMGGTAPVTIGHYPGNSGNGTIDNPTQTNPGSNGSEGRNGSGSGSGSGIDTTGLAQESSLQSLGGLVTQIRDAIAGTVSGSGFTATTPGQHANVNISPDIQAKQTELSTKLAQVKSEFSTLINFGSASTASALQCPTNSGFQFNGSTISLCTQSVLNSTATIGNVLIFLAFVVSLYILLS